MPAAVAAHDLIVGIGERDDPAPERGGVGRNVVPLAAVLRHQRLDQRENVLDAVVQLLVQRLLPHVRFAPLACEHFGMAHHDFEQLHARGFRRLTVVGAPRRGLAAHRLLPDREALARREPVAVRTAGVSLVGVAAPVQGFDLLPAEEHEEIAWQLRKRRRQQSGGLRRIVPRFGQRLRQRMRRKHPPLAHPGQKTGERVEALPRRRDAMRMPFAIHGQADAVTGNQQLERRKATEQELRDMGLRRGLGHDAVERLARAGGGGQRLGALEGLYAQREHFGEHFGRDALGQRERLGRIVVAGDQAPELAVDNHRERHRRGHAHVTQIFEMDRRHGAQMRKGQIERSAAGVERGRDRDAAILRVVDDAEGVAQIELARLSGNVAGRKMLAEKAFEFRPSVLGDDFAGAVLGETIDHRAVVTEHGAQQARRDGEEISQRRPRLRARNQAAGDVERARLAGVRRLELDQGMIVVRMHANIEARAGARQPAIEQQPRPARVARFAERVAQLMRERLTHEIGEDGALEAGGIESEHGGGVRGMASHRLQSRVAGDQASMRLHRAGDMDRLAVTIGQVYVIRQNGLRPPVIRAQR